MPTTFKSNTKQTGTWPRDARRRFGLWPLLTLIVAAGCVLVAMTRPADAGTVAITEAALKQHVTELANRVPDGFTVIVESPFVVLGNESPETVRRRATHTVKWAVDKLKQEFFQTDPAEIIDIWLFRDGDSYTNHIQALFGDIPTTRFGYYSAAHHALIMNIGTGGGTLVHEIVHPFIRANFPACPPWFDEGLASLYEAAAEKNGHIQGQLNWRYKGLEKAIKDGQTISFQRLTAMTPAEFYGGASYNQYYAQARYLCYYLQEKGLLVTFYRQFVDSAAGDPTGYATLKNVLREKDMAAFKRKWENFILGLRGS